MPADVNSRGRPLGPCLIHDCKDVLQQQMFRLVAIWLDLTHATLLVRGLEGKAADSVRHGFKLGT
jgi:hypothetical protein